MTEAVRLASWSTGLARVNQSGLKLVAVLVRMAAGRYEMACVGDRAWAQLDRAGASDNLGYDFAHLN